MTEINEKEINQIKKKINSGQFKKGHPGGPGRPMGSRNKVTVLLEKMGLEEVETIWRAILDLAKGGDLNACKIVMDKVMPARKGAFYTVENLTREMNQDDIGKFASRTVAAFEDGFITTEEMKDVLDGLEKAIKVMTSTQLIAKLNELAQQVNNRVNSQLEI